MAEMRDIYDENYQYLGYSKDRSIPLDNNEYILVAGAFILSRGHLLVTQRAKEKTYAHKWEITMGSILSGEKSLEGALREIQEEVGIEASPEEMAYLGFRKEENKFAEIYLLEKDIDTIVLQKEEVESYKFIDRKELDHMLENHDFARPMEERILAYYNQIRKKMK